MLELAFTRSVHLLTKCISDHDVFTDTDHGVQACSFRGIHTLDCSFHAWRGTYHARKNLGLFFFIDTALQTGLQAITKTNV